ncbi:MAG: Ig-like domain-containing protein [Gammaproteobacteria bacterium]|nr:Ig-like domain-containing protein [Gammaproteobacteria bacterium]
MRLDNPRWPLNPILRASLGRVGRALTVAILAVACGDGGPTAPPPVPNRGPQPAGSIPAQTVEVGQTVALEVSTYFTDPDGDPLSYAASSSDPAVAAVAVSGAMVTVTALAKGSVTVTVMATDPGGLSATQTLEVAVPNRAPEPAAPIPDHGVEVGRTVALEVSPYFTDPDGDVLSYAAATSAPSVSTASVSGAVVTIQGVAVGETTLTLTARDPEGGAATQQAKVTVTPPAPDLEFTGVSPATATLTPGSSVTFEFRIHNQGTVASGATTIRAMRSPNPIISVRDTELRSFSLLPLAASEDQTFPLTISVDASTAPGTVYIGMCIDPVMGESNTRNNCSEGARLTISAPSSGRKSANGVSADGGSAIRIQAPRPVGRVSDGAL